MQERRRLTKDDENVVELTSVKVKPSATSSATDSLPSSQNACRSRRAMIALLVLTFTLLATAFCTKNYINDLYQRSLSPPAYPPRKIFAKHESPHL